MSGLGAWIAVALLVGGIGSAVPAAGAQEEDGVRAAPATETSGTTAADWYRASPAVEPPGVIYNNLVYDEANDQAILLGGFLYGGAGAIWTYDVASNNWSRYNTSGPSPRSWAGTAYDSDSKKIVLQGGSDGGSVLGDTWVYDTATKQWTNANPSPGGPLRWGQKMAYDSITKKVYMFGGFGPYPQRDSSLWSYDVGANQWQNVTPPGPAPPHRIHAGLATDPHAKGILLFGGCGDLGIPCSQLKQDTWFYDPVAKTWTDMNPSSKPLPRDHLGMAFDGNQQKVMAYGGSIGSGMGYEDTWHFDWEGRKWIQDFPAHSPGPHHQGGMAGASKPGGAVVLFGGQDWGSGGQNGYKMTWVYSNNWTAQPPRVVTTWPAGGATGVAVDEQVHVDFNMPMDPASTTAAFSISPAVAGGSAAVYTTRLSWSHTANYAANTTYTVTVDASAKGTNGASMASPYSFSFTVGSAGGGAVPLVASTVPASGATGVAIDAKVEVTFSIDMEPKSTGAAFAISPGVSGGTASASGKVLSWNHTSAFAAAEYTVTIAKSATSAAGVPMAGDHVFKFTTVGGTPAPKVSSTSPANGATGVAQAEPVTVTFDMDMDPAATAAALSLSPSVAGGTASVTGKILTWAHPTDFATGTAYTVTVSTAAKSVAGANLGSPHVFSFTTGSGTPVPKVVDTSPKDGATNVPPNAVIAVTFDSEMDPGATEKAVSSTPTIAGKFSWNADGTELTLKPDAALQLSTQHTVIVGESAAAKSGVALGAEFKFAFRTGASPDDTPPKIAHTPVTEAPEGAAIELQATVTDAGGVKSVALHYRKQGAAGWKTANFGLQSDDLWTGAIPAGDVSIGVVEYYLEASDIAANRATDPAAGASAPHKVKVAARSAASSSGELAMWIAIAVLVGVVAALLAALLARRRSQKEAQANQGRHRGAGPGSWGPQQWPAEWQMAQQQQWEAQPQGAGPQAPGGDEVVMRNDAPVVARPRDEETATPSGEEAGGGDA